MDRLSMNRFLLPFGLVYLIALHGSARADVKASALVQVADPKRGSISDTLIGYGIVESENTLTRSFQRDGLIAEIMVEVAEKARAAVWVSPFSARSSFPERHPQFAGFLHAVVFAVEKDDTAKARGSFAEILVG